MLKPSPHLTVADVAPQACGVFEHASARIRSIDRAWDSARGAPIFTVQARYTRCKLTVQAMAPHVSHTGVHDHGFNNIRTYGNLLRLLNEGHIPESCSRTGDGSGYLYCFNGTHSLYTIRPLRWLAMAHRSGHALTGENDIASSPLQRLFEHARYSVDYGEGRDRYDVTGRIAHETRTRELAWAMCGTAERLECFRTLHGAHLGETGVGVDEVMLKTAQAVCEFFIENSRTDGLTYWETGAPGLDKTGDWGSRASDAVRQCVPVDSSVPALEAQGLFRLGRYLNSERGESCMWGDYHLLELARSVMRLADNRPYETFWSTQRN